MQAKEGVYAAYGALTENVTMIGVPLGSAGAFAATKTFCDNTPACIGIKVGATNVAGAEWQAFGGALFPGVTAKVKYYSANLDSWIAEPDA